MDEATRTAELRTLRRVSLFVIAVAVGWMLISMKLVSQIGELSYENARLREVCALGGVK